VATLVNVLCTCMRFNHPSTPTESVTARYTSHLRFRFFKPLFSRTGRRWIRSNRAEAAAWKSHTWRRRHTTDLWNASDWIPKWLQTLHFSLRSDLTVSLKKPLSSATRRRFSPSPFLFRFVIAGLIFHCFSSCCCRSSKQNSFNCRSNLSPYFSLLGSDN